MHTKCQWYGFSAFQRDSYSVSQSISNKHNNCRLAFFGFLLLSNYPQREKNVSIHFITSMVSNACFQMEKSFFSSFLFRLSIEKWNHQITLLWNIHIFSPYSFETIPKLKYTYRRNETLNLNFGIRWANQMNWKKRFVGAWKWKECMR